MMNTKKIIFIVSLLAFLLAPSLSNAQGGGFDLEYLSECMTDEVAPDVFVEFTRVYNLNTGNTINLNSSLTGVYLPSGIVRKCEVNKSIDDLLDSLISFQNQLRDSIKSPVWHEENGLLDGQVKTFENCQKITLTWGIADTLGVAAAGSISVENLRTNKRSRYSQISGIAPSWSVNSGFVETIKIDATASTGLYYISQGCESQPYDCITPFLCDNDNVPCIGWLTPSGECWLNPSGQPWSLPN